MEDDDDLYSKLYGEVAPASPEPPKIFDQNLQHRQTPQITSRADGQTEAAVEAYAPGWEEPELVISEQEAVKDVQTSGAAEESSEVPIISSLREEEQDDELDIRLDEQLPRAAEDEEELDITLDDSRDAQPSGPNASGEAKVAHRYVRPGVQPSVRQSLQSAGGSELAGAPAVLSRPTSGQKPSQRPPSYPSYDPDDAGVLPSQASAAGQRIRLPGQTRVTPEEYREFLGLGHGDIFNLEIDDVIDAPWRVPGADPGDFFNYGLTARTWKDYCGRVKQFQLEYTMQRKIQVYDKDGKLRSSNDPDLPPELAAAVAERRQEGSRRTGQEAVASTSMDHKSLEWHSSRSKTNCPPNFPDLQNGSMSTLPMPDMTGLPFPPFQSTEWEQHGWEGRRISDDGSTQEDQGDTKRRRMEVG